MSPALHLLFSTPHVHVVSKPAHLTTIPGVFSPSGPAVSTLLYQFLRAASGSSPTPFPATPSHLVSHRLDYSTSGLLLMPSSAAGSSALSHAFKARLVHKTYEAVVDTRALPPTSPLAGSSSGEVCLPLGKRRGVPLLHTACALSAAAPLRPCHTQWRVLQRSTGTARLELTPVTGRTHQLRLHCALGLGAPIVGDALYGHTGAFAEELASMAAPRTPELQEYLMEAQQRRLPSTGATRLLLHARALTLPHSVFWGSGGSLQGGTAALGSGGGEEGATQLEDCRGRFVASGRDWAGAAGQQAFTLQCKGEESVTVTLQVPF